MASCLTHPKSRGAKLFTPSERDNGLKINNIFARVLYSPVRGCQASHWDQQVKVRSNNSTTLSTLREKETTPALNKTTHHHHHHKLCSHVSKLLLHKNKTTFRRLLIHHWKVTAGGTHTHTHTHTHTLYLTVFTPYIISIAPIGDPRTPKFKNFKLITSKFSFLQ